jgi:hypothetical protein
MSAAFLPAVNSVIQIGTRARTLAPEILGTTITSGGAITAWQVHAQWAVSITAGLVGLVAGILTIRSLLRKEKELQ